MSPNSTSQHSEKSCDPALKPESTVIADFEAVSYTWGFIDALSEVKVIKVLPRSATIETIAIGPNLRGLLHRLRRAKNTRTLWINAICINQDDQHEKSQQVPRMRAIFAFAKRIVI
jgi:hypothetical protein